MVVAVPVPRLNANDDTIQVLRVAVSQGDTVVAGQVVAELQTEKAVVEVEAPQAGVVLGLGLGAGEMVPVGSPLLWLGEPGETVPALGADDCVSDKPLRRGSAKAIKALWQANRSGVADAARRAVAPPQADPEPVADADPSPLSPQQRAMARMVGWHAAVAVPAYLEVPFDGDAWALHAKNFADSNNLAFDPSLGLLAHALVDAMRRFPLANATLQGDRLLTYRQVNLGFSVKTRNGLVMVVGRNAGELDRLALVRRLFDLQRAAFANRLKTDETSGMTVALTSLGPAVRHVPVLPPNTGLIVAHSGRGATIGATYDHRLLDGAIVASILALLERPGADA